MNNQILNFVNISLEDMTCIMREIVASELQKAKEIILPTPIDDSDKILTREEVCKLLKVSLTTLFNWNNDKTLVNYKVGRRVYYMKTDVLALLNPIKAVS
jgi:excisionase family DNA binding protein